jgi:cytochrome c-type biogenesis protein CcsB
MNSSLILSWTTWIYGFAAFLYLLAWIFRKELPGRLATWIIIIGWCFNTVGITLRWIESYRLQIGHAPLSNLYESLIFFAWSIALIYVFIERKYQNRMIGAFIAPLTFLIMAYASLSPHISARIQPLVPALKSNWLIAHVITCFIGYAAFAIAFGVSFIYLIKQRKDVQAIGWLDVIKPVILFLVATLMVRIIFQLPIDRSAIIGLVLSVGGYLIAYGWRKLPSESRNRLLDRLPEPKALDDLNYQLVMFGFLFLTAGIITGAVWANSAWGRYWGWDPKETWSLITWFIYATLLHAKLMRGWHGRRIAYICLFGFLAVLFTYFGVNLLPGLHSYGAMGQ